MTKAVLLIILSIFIFTGLSAQNDDGICIKIQNANDHYCSKKYNKAAKILDKAYDLDLSIYDSSKSFRLSIANAYYHSKKNKKANNIYNDIVEIKSYPKTEVVFIEDICIDALNRCPTFVCPKRLLENQHEACIMLAKSYLKKKRFDQAFEHIQNADLYYRYWYGCGTTDLENDLKLSLLYAEYFKGVKLIDSAISKLLKNILEPAALPVPYYEEVKKEASKLIKKKYSIEKRTGLINESIENLYYVSFDSHHGEKESRTYYINFLGVEIKVSPEYLFERNKDLEEVKSYLRKTDFYKSITS